ncbi:hypothetical protein CRE_20886 [Caenorhabditis remanei]|uniref:Uncharacterized protein n=1 Tax=Caenorhabditis remanei TaxID=31234 RepID=E3MV44_CAERE|nr:hypothetical protein CRE_20886 [Caenorhabditis remanei]
MSNLSCAPPTDVDRLRRPDFLLSLVAGFIITGVTFYYAYLALCLIWKTPTYERTAKTLLSQLLFFSVMYEIFYCIEEFISFYKSIFDFFGIYQECIPLQSALDCALRFKCLMGFTSGMIYNQTGLIIERLFATIFTEKYTNKIKLNIRVIVFWVVPLSSILTAYLIVLDDPLEGYVFACYVIPRQSILRTKIFLVTCFVLTLLVSIMALLIRKHNKKYEFSTRFKVSSRFQNRQAIETTNTICILSLFSSIFLFIYTVGIFVLLAVRPSISPFVFNIFVTYVYVSFQSLTFKQKFDFQTIPFVAFMIPHLIIYRIRVTRRKRVHALNGFAQVKQTQDEHINELRVMWS